MYEHIIVERLELLVEGIDPRNLDEPLQTVRRKEAKRVSRSKVQNLGYIRSLSIESHPRIIAICKSDKTHEDRLDDARPVLIALRDSLESLLRCDSLTNRPDSHRMRHLSVNRYRPSDCVSLQDEANPELDVDTLLVDLIYAMNPITACISGGGLGHVARSTCSDPCSLQPRRSRLLDSGRCSDTRWIAHCDLLPSHSLISFMSRIPQLDLLSVKSCSLLPEYKVMQQAMVNYGGDTRHVMRLNAWAHTTTAYLDFLDVSIARMRALVTASGVQHPTADHQTCQHRWTFYPDYDRLPTPPGESPDSWRSVYGRDADIDGEIERIRVRLMQEDTGLAEKVRTMEDYVTSALRGAQETWYARSDALRMFRDHHNALMHPEPTLEIRQSDLAWRRYDVGESEEDGKGHRCPCSA